MSIKATDFIKVRGLDGDYNQDAGAYFEVFQGTAMVNEGGEGASVTNLVDALGETTLMIARDTSTPISEDEALAEGIWQGQNEKLEHENNYCDQLQKLIQKKQERIAGIWDKFLDVVEELIGDFLKMIIMPIVMYNTGSLSLTWLAGLLTEIGVEWGLEALQSLLTRGNELLDGIKAENNKLLKIEKSRENYEYRELALSRHREDIKIILEQIRLAEKSVELNTQLEMKALLERLTDLALRDDTIEFGDMRLHSRGKVVEY